MTAGCSRRSSDDRTHYSHLRSPLIDRSNALDQIAISAHAQRVFDDHEVEITRRKNFGTCNKLLTTI